MSRKRGSSILSVSLVFLALLTACQPAAKTESPPAVTFIPMRIETYTPVPEPTITPTTTPLAIPVLKTAYPIPTLDPSISTPKNQPTAVRAFHVDNLVGITYNKAGDRLVVIDKDSVFFYYPEKMTIAKNYNTDRLKTDPLEYGSTETYSYTQSNDMEWLALGQWAHYISSKGSSQHGVITTLQLGNGLTIRLGEGINPNVMAAPVINVRYSPDNKYVAGEMDSEHNAVKIWNLKDELLYTLNVFDGLKNMVFAPDQDRVAFCSTSGYLQIHEISTGDFVASLGRFSSNLSNASCGVNYSQYGNWLAYYGDDQLINLWDARGSSIVRHLPTPGGDLAQILISPNEQDVATLGTNGFVRVWNINGHNEVFSWGDESTPITALTYSPDGHYLIGNDTKGNLLFWTPTQKEYTARILGNKVVFSPDNQTIITTTADGQVLFWDPESLEKNE